MIPAPWEFVLLTLGVFRLVRLVGWDDLPPVAAVRRWLTGTVEDGEYERHRRPLLAHFLACPFCVGAWLALAAYLLWLWQPEWTVAVCVPLALSAAVGLAAKNWDP